MLPGSSLSVASAEGSHWDTAVAILMLRHSMTTGTLNCPEIKKLGALRELRDLGIYSETIKRSSRQNARSARRRMTMRRPQKNGGTEVETFFWGLRATRAATSAARRSPDLLREGDWRLVAKIFGARAH